MTYSALHQGGKGSQAERGSRPTGAPCCLPRSHATPFPFVRIVGAPGISLSAGSLPAGSAGRSCRSHSASHVEAAATHRGVAAEACKEQRPDDGCDCDQRARSVPANKEEAWLSRAPEAACPKFALTMPLIACSSPSSSRPTLFWFPHKSAPWGA